MRFGEKLVLVATLLIFSVTQFSFYISQANSQNNKVKERLEYFSALKTEIDYNYTRVKRLNDALDANYTTNVFHFEDRIYVAGIESGSIDIIGSKKVQEVDAYYLHLSELGANMEELAASGGHNIELQKQALKPTITKIEAHYKQSLNISPDGLKSELNDTYRGLSSAKFMLILYWGCTLGLAYVLIGQLWTMGLPVLLADIWRFIRRIFRR